MHSYNSPEIIVLEEKKVSQTEGCYLGNEPLGDDNSILIDLTIPHS